MYKELSSFAVREDYSKGRMFKENAHCYRGAFDRDRDRIIHSSAFRRLEGKTQVFGPGVDDNFRTRLTHSIEVSQVGRTISRVLCVNEDLTEAICLGHDLGHSPFGHCGEKILDELMSGFGGFEHNVQSLRIVDVVEHPYTGFQGLNLMYETRLGLAKHSSPYDEPGESGFLERCCSIEGQIADVSDRIAYNCHDLEDGQRSRLINIEDLKELELYRLAFEKANAAEIKDSFLRNIRVSKTMLEVLVSDLITESQKRIKAASPASVEDVYKQGGYLIGISDKFDEMLRELERFLMEQFYLSDVVAGQKVKAKEILSGVFETLVKSPDKMPGYYRTFIEEYGLQRVVCDYISGMTDDYCVKIFNKECAC